MGSSPSVAKGQIINVNYLSDIHLIEVAKIKYKFLSGEQKE